MKESIRIPLILKPKKIQWSSQGLTIHLFTALLQFFGVGWEKILPSMVKLGIWDADRNGGPLYWRLDFWNNKLRRLSK